MLALGCGERTVRYRPPLNVSRDEIDEGADLTDKTIEAIRG